MPARTSAGTIRTRLLGIVLAALLPLLVLGGWQAALAYRDSQSLVANRLRANTWAMSDRGRDPFVVARHLLVMASQHPDVHGATARCNAVLGDVRRQATGTVNVLRTDVQGVVRCSGMPFEPGQRVDHGEWWQRARAGEGMVLSKPRMGEVSHKPVIVLGLRLGDATGKFDGTLSAGISLEELHADLRRQVAGKRGTALLVDARGQTILSAGEGRIPRIGPPRRALSEPQHIMTDRGEDWIYVASPLFGDTLYAVYAEERSTLATRALMRMWLILALPLLAALLATAAIWLGTQRLLLSWFPRLHRLATRFAIGDFAAQDPAFARAPAEIAELAGSLNDMARSLEAHERELHEALEARMALTREVNHRVRNNLQIVISLLTMQAARARDRHEREIVGQVRVRLTALALIQRLIYEGDGGEVGRVNVGTMIGHVCEQMRETHRHAEGITLECDIGDAALDVDKAMPLLLFTVEAITNAYRHAFGERREGHIMLRFLAQEGIGMLEIEDDGHGFATEAGQRRMGLDLMEAFAAQLGGQTATHADASGVSVTLTFPLV